MTPVASPESLALRATAEQHLQALVGTSEARLRDDQWTAIEALVLQHRRALVVQRTGWGKSAVYFVATLLLREAGAGPTVIISPLLALMRNQIAAAQAAGIRAVTINSTNAESWQPIHEAINAGEVDVLLVSPERLNNPGFRDEVLPQLAGTAGLLVIDEAHCISDWGHDFRPDYRRIRTLLAELPEGIPVLATTATANARVTRDVAEQLGDALVLRGSLDRESLRLAVLKLRGAEQRLAWLADHLGELPGSGIIYCLTVAATHEVADHLRAAGHEVAAYSGQTDTDERQRLEQALLDGEVKALVATSALGMGFDAALGFVVNLGAPGSPVAYYQQVGRAGRGVRRSQGEERGLAEPSPAGLREKEQSAGRGRAASGDGAVVVLLPQPEDRDIWAYFASLGFPPESVVRNTLAALEEAGRPLSTAALEPLVELSRNRLETMLKVLDVDGAVRRVQGGWTSTGEPWSYDRERHARVAEARLMEQQAMLDYLDSDQCRLRFLREQLDDAEAADCGRCDNCGGISLSVDMSTQALEEAAGRLARPGVNVEPRRMWPTALGSLGLNLKGKIVGADEGRAVARLTDLGHGQALRDLFGLNPDGTALDGPVPVPLVQAVVEVLGEWQPRPDAIVFTESARRPTLTRDLADGLSRYLQVPIVAMWAIHDHEVPPDAGAMNSAQRVAAVSRRCGLVTQGEVRGRVLLVDDQVVTGWSITCAAAALRAAGADAVLPLVLAVPH